jgi:ATP-dependent exoDNAse (exonuclease V) beta subunit
MATKDLESTSNGHQLKFNAATHRYWMNGKPVKGVSGIKDAYPKGDGLTNWKIKQGIEQALPMYRAMFSEFGPAFEPNAAFMKAQIDALMVEVKKEKKTKKAADIGTLLHEYAYCKENHLPFDYELVNQHPDKLKVENAIANFETWHATSKDIVIRSEQIVGSWTHWFAGTFDRLVSRNGLIVLSDFKTSNSIGVEMKLQLAAYRIAIREWLGIEVQALEVLRFDKEKVGFDPVKDVWFTDDAAEMKEHEEQFLNLLKTVRYDAKHNPFARR